MVNSKSERIVFPRTRENLFHLKQKPHHATRSPVPLVCGVMSLCSSVIQILIVASPHSPDVKKQT